MSRMDAAKTSAASGTRHWWSGKKPLAVKASRSDPVPPKKPEVKEQRRLAAPCRVRAENLHENTDCYRTRNIS
jgi:hypothetical protein